MDKKEVEALLFSSGRKMNVEELAKLCRSNPELVREQLIILQAEYEEKESPLMLVEEGSSWKLTVRERYLDLVKNIVTETELSKSCMETLAVIAFKYPVVQADVIKIRTNKAYEDIKLLEEAGYVVKEKFGRTFKLKLTEKFFHYFDLPEKDLKEKFSDFKQIEEAIEQKEKDIEEAKQKNIDKLKQEKDETEKKRKEAEEEIEKLDKLEVFEEPKIEEDKEKLGDLEVVDEPEEAEKETEEGKSGEEASEEKETTAEEAEKDKEESPEEADAEQEESESEENSKETEEE
ncbi:MAG: SMC-Scp complex subunit ScpB [Candidatus Woesearchaeota archaeon]|nr:SMC-Scp complex subunit ScpB [Candidatus Woesearchaeota archaeon]